MEPEAVTVQYQPELDHPLLIAAFTGWPDAAEVASATVRYLVRKLRASRFAAIESESFYDFTQQRPHATIAPGDQRRITWPVAEFYAVPSSRSGRDLVLFVGPEPHARWRTYTTMFLDLAERTGVTEMVTLGGAYDAVPHTGEPKLSITSTERDLLRRFTALGLEPSSYEGPTSIHSALTDAAPDRGIAVASIWGAAPDYVQAVPNWKVCYATLLKLQQVYGLRADLNELRSAGRALERRVERMLAHDPDLRAYVQQIQDLAGASPSSPVVVEDLDAESVLEEIDAMLRSGPAGDLRDDD